MKEIANIIIHCTASEWGCMREVNKWHKARGWRTGGYHFVIQNGFPTLSHLQENNRMSSLDGHVECGRHLDEDFYIEGNEVGAHALGYNRKSIGIALVGNTEFTVQQMFSLTRLVKELCRLKAIEYSQVLGHYEVTPARSCPNFDVGEFRKDLDAGEYFPKKTANKTEKKGYIKRLLTKLLKKMEEGGR